VRARRRVDDAGVLIRGQVVVRRAVHVLVAVPKHQHPQRLGRRLVVSGQGDDLVLCRHELNQLVQRHARVEVVGGRRLPRALVRFLVAKRAVVKQLHPRRDVVDKFQVVGGLARKLVLHLSVAGVPHHVEGVRVSRAGLAFGRGVEAADHRADFADGADLGDIDGAAVARHTALVGRVVVVRRLVRVIVKLIVVEGGGVAPPTAAAAAATTTTAAAATAAAAATTTAATAASASAGAGAAAAAGVRSLAALVGRRAVVRRGIVGSTVPRPDLAGRRRPLPAARGAGIGGYGEGGEQQGDQKEDEQGGRDHPRRNRRHEARRGETKAKKAASRQWGRRRDRRH